MEGVLSIRVVDGSMDEVIPIDVAPSLMEADDPFRANVVRWVALDVPSIMVEEDLKKLREAYRIPADIELMLPEHNERAYFLMRGCTALHLNAFVSGMRLPLHPLFRRILRTYGLGSDLGFPKWMESDGKGHVFVISALLRLGNAFACVPDYLPAEEVVEEKSREEELGWYYFCPCGSHRLLVTDVLPRCELSRDVVDVVRSIYQAAPLTQRYELILNRHCCLVELGLMASKVEMDQERRPRPTLARLMKQRPRVLVPGSAKDTSQKKVIEDLSRERNMVEVATLDVVEVEDLGTPEEDAPLKKKRETGTFGSGPS
ncbi:putative abhydrolase domain-containing protein [Abeliophyllum distichum]|uniref:Abhydrolase domain-containing protein n=1 Tax=Abeliophyllum distichum TaxID=126358 RepID=A0ABD1PUD9_9LAMI